MNFWFFSLAFLLNSKQASKHTLLNIEVCIHVYIHLQ